MTFDNNVPEWKNEGSDPPDTLKEEGFTAGYKPPAAYFNWFFNRIQKSVKEIQEKLSNDLKAMAFKEDIGGEDISETVIETLDTVEDKYPVPAAGESVKRFFGKILTFLRNIRPLTGNLTLYVSASTGSDATGDGSELNPYASITKALDTISKNLNGFVPRVYVSGGVYLESINIANYTNGHLDIILSGDVTINDLTVDNSYVMWHGSGGSYTLTTDYILIDNKGKLSAYSTVNLSMVGYNTYGTDKISVRLDNGSAMYASGIITIQGNDGSAISSGALSKVFIDTIRGEGLSTGLTAWSGGQISYVLNQLSANYPISVWHGTVIKSGDAIIGALSGNKSIYVSTSGSDLTGSGSQGNPFRTIQFAINSLPRDLGGNIAYVYLESGTYNESVNIPGFHSGQVYITRSDAALILNTDYNVKNFYIRNCEARISIVSINLTSTDANGILSDQCSDVVIHYCQANGSAPSNYGFRFDYTNKARIVNCKSTNHKSALSVYSSRILSADWNTSSGMEYGIESYGSGIVIKSGPQPSGNTANEYNNGGVLFSNTGTQIYGPYTSGLSCTWGTIQGGYVRHGNTNGIAMVTLQFRIILTTSISSGSTYTIMGFPKGINSVNVAVACSIQYSNCYIDVGDGGVRFQPAGNLIAGQSFVFNCTYLTNS